ncbi:HAMP domain-containing histidine kinase [Nocardioides sp. zg-536]|uniref:histidine kinase n=1 Tax=Nocardioides faecalis TaxID=2803858 RepID=A0A938Y930_9ACTN|nr:HAMP domain-containing sensor histidine kinase [Nocardioides faecalis]MBM9461437.1 HAMP domain-containing histidine kinase [Nocardioides faecalis]QVI59374.1 HAMP domain-containing histidine kinase [Nocardioides faecalis]
MTAPPAPRGDGTDAPKVFQQQALVAAVAVATCAVPAVFDDAVRQPPFILGWMLLAGMLVGTAIAPRWFLASRTVQIPLLVDIVALVAIGAADPALTAWFATAVPVICLARGIGGRAALAGSLLSVAAIAVGGVWAHLALDVDPVRIAAVGIAAVVVGGVASAHLGSSRRTLLAQATLLQRQAVMLEAALEQARSDGSRVQEILDTVDFAVVTYGDDIAGARLNETGRSLLSQLGFPPDIAVDQLPVYAMDGTTPLGREPWEELGAGRVDAVECWLGHPGGKRVALSVTASTTRRKDPASGRVQVVVAARDITRERRAIEARDDMVTSLSHELRTPLSSILGYLDLVTEDTRLDPSHREMLEIALRNAKRMLSLVSDLLHARSDSASAGLSITVTSCDLVRMLDESLESVRPLAADRLIAVSVDAPEALVIEGDPFRLRHVVDNLLSNAVKYNEPGGWIDITLAPEPAGFVTLSVSNTGHALSAEEQARLFERFYRGDSARGSTVHGTGVGLSIAREIVVLHGGSIDVESYPDGDTTTLTVVLPVEQDELEGLEDEPDELREEDRSASAYAPTWTAARGYGETGDETGHETGDTTGDLDDDGGAYPREKAEATMVSSGGEDE